MAVWEGADRLVLFPNPVRSEPYVLHLNLPPFAGLSHLETTGARVSVFDLTGREVAQKEVQGAGLVEVSLAGLAEGVYLVRVRLTTEAGTVNLPVQKVALIR